ncbi:unnamed protein product [Blepharisma stoltei]|uniref:Uncharacterized protein n=1 Tax=Blepharisma stoltei TaxID=1481888 RepID=A0AAU9JJ22_9CILI|nr:unnamed protein product [Blepharisma stoltei]
MFSFELSADQEERLNSILDKGIESFNQSPEKFTEIPISNSFISDQSTQQIFKSDLEGMQDKIAILESRVQNSQTHKRSKSSSRYRSESPSELILRSIHKSELEIEEMERSIMSTSSSSKDIPLTKKSDSFKAELFSERQKNIQKRKENELLRKKLNHKEDLQMKFARLQEDYNILMQSFERSENIRLKQKEVIEQLKLEIVECDEKNIEETPKFNDKKHFKSVGKEGIRKSVIKKIRS